MTNMQPIPNDAVLIAIDVAKVRNEVLIEAANHRRRRRLTVLNNRIEHDRFIATLAGYNRPVICAFETTGNYHRPLAWRPTEAGFEARLVSSMALVRTREALGGKERYVILSEQLLGVLRSYWHLAWPESFLFPRRDKDKPIDQTVLHAGRRSARAAARIDKRVSVHVLPHSFERGRHSHHPGAARP